MSGIWRFRSSARADLDAVLRYLRSYISRSGENFPMGLAKYPGAEYGGRFFAEGASARGVEVAARGGEIFVALDVLSNMADCSAAFIVLSALRLFLGADVLDEDGEPAGAMVFSDANVRAMLKKDALNFMKTLSAVNGTLRVDGVVRPVFFGARKYRQFSEYIAAPERLAREIENFMLRMQYGLPSYGLPDLAADGQKNYGGENGRAKIRVMFPGRPYILQDYDLLMIGDTGGGRERILINNEDLLSILPESWTLADDFTVVAPALGRGEWRAFVEGARAKNRADDGAKKITAAFSREDARAGRRNLMDGGRSAFRASDALVDLLSASERQKASEK